MEGRDVQMRVRRDVSMVRTTLAVQGFLLGAVAVIVLLLAVSIAGRPFCPGGRASECPPANVTGIVALGLLGIAVATALLVGAVCLPNWRGAWQVAMAGESVLAFVLTFGAAMLLRSGAGFVVGALPALHSAYIVKVLYDPDVRAACGA
jgi:hypothetical protein